MLFTLKDASGIAVAPGVEIAKDRREKPEKRKGRYG
jgi:hypothetical protein